MVVGVVEVVVGGSGRWVVLLGAELVDGASGAVEVRLPFRAA